VKISAHKYFTSGPADVAELERWLNDGSVNAEEIICIIGKTEGNGGRNDFTRELAMLALEKVLCRQLKLSKEELSERIVFSISGGCEGALSPHIIVFCRDGNKKTAANPKRRLAMGIGQTHSFAPEEIGRMAQIKETAYIIEQIMEEIQIESKDDVHLILIKSAVPPFAPEQAKSARKSGQPLRSDMIYSRAASALGAALALEEVYAVELDDENICQDWTIYSSVASCSAQRGLMKSEIVVLGNSPYWDGDLEINHGVLQDMLDIETVFEVLAGLGINPQGPTDPILKSLVGVFAKSEADPRGTIRGRRHTMLSDDDVSDTRYSRCVLGAVLASILNDTALNISTRAEHQGPLGGGTLAILARKVVVMLVAYLVAIASPCWAQSRTTAKTLLTQVGSSSLASESAVTPKEAHPKYNANALHRLDFRIEGKSCAICLYRIQERVKDLPGTVKSAVMLKKPYAAVIIYDSTQLSLNKIEETAKKGEPEVKLVDIKDEAIKKLPTILIPLYSQAQTDPATN
jgi:cyanuric acid amidohydrolase